MVIVEGIDGSGKSTLAKRLAKDLGIGRFHFVGPPHDIREFRSRCCLSAINFYRPIVQDRTPFISEPIYGVLDNREIYMTKDESYCSLAIPMLRPILIYCRPETNFLHRPEKHENPEYLKLINDNWNRLLDSYDTFMCSLHAIRYDWAEKIESINYRGILKLCNTKIKQAGF
jgi:hypothetical protein